MQFHIIRQKAKCTYINQPVIIPLLLHSPFLKVLLSRWTNNGSALWLWFRGMDSIICSIGNYHGTDKKLYLIDRLHSTPFLTNKKENTCSLTLLVASSHPSWSKECLTELKGAILTSFSAMHSLKGTSLAPTSSHSLLLGLTFSPILSGRTRIIYPPYTLMARLCTQWWDLQIHAPGP